MGKTLNEIAQELKDANKKVQLIYAFNGTGKTRLSKEFKTLINTLATDETEEDEERKRKILYYNAFTEDLFYWDNDLEGDSEHKLKIRPNEFTNWVLKDQGQDTNIINKFQYYTSDKLSPKFSEDFEEVTFSIKAGNDETLNNIKISKGEESNFVWSLFYCLIEQVIDILNVIEPEDRETDKLNLLEYVFIDDPVSSLDDNHLIELAVDVAQLIKSSESDLKFIITTHNPLFYNVLHNELNNPNKETGYKKNHFKKHRLEKNEDGTHELLPQSSDSPFSYHLFLKEQIEKAIDSEQLYKYHFSFLRNILEKTSTFLGYSGWGDLLIPVKGDRLSYEKRILNLSSHSKHSAEEIITLTKDEKNVLKHLLKEITEIYKFKQEE